MKIKIADIAPFKRIRRTPRRKVDRREAAEALDLLAENIRSHGQLQNIVVRKAKDGYELIAGSRRLAALKKLGEREVDAKVVRADDEEAILIALSENISRRDLTVVELGELYWELKERWPNKYGSAKRIAAALHLTQPTVSEPMRIVSRIPPDADIKYVAGKLGRVKSSKIVQVEDKERREDLMRKALKEKIGARIINIVVDILNGDPELSVEDALVQAEALIEFGGKKKKEQVPVGNIVVGPVGEDDMNIVTRVTAQLHICPSCGGPLKYGSFCPNTKCGWTELDMEG